VSSSVAGSSFLLPCLTCDKLGVGQSTMQTNSLQLLYSYEFNINNDVY
jgi:hypothetical protein